MGKYLRNRLFWWLAVLAVGLEAMVIKGIRDPGWVYDGNHLEWFLVLGDHLGRHRSVSGSKPWGAIGSAENRQPRAEVMQLILYGGLWLFGGLCVIAAIYNLVTYWMTNKRVFFRAGMLMLFATVFLVMLIIRFTPA